MSAAPPPEAAADRRQFVGDSAAMAVGLCAGYGCLGAFALRYLYGPGSGPRGWLFVARPGEVAVGQSLSYTAPSGQRIVVARQAERGEASDFIALSSICPHLGCQVHWEPQNDRFFCPCHNGAFDPQGNPTAGPPAQAGTPLVQFPLRIQDGLLEIEVPLGGLRVAGQAT